MSTNEAIAVVPSKQTAEEFIKACEVQDLKQAEEFNIAFREVFVLHYLKGSHSLILHFRQPGGKLADAILRSRRFCDIMRYRHVICRPFITDLAEEEKKVPF